ncbi:GNAT family N-acetyltransferase [Bacillus sp. 1P06AnD]|uniref:GNAT family N-acetyltransferase n=1 Tax=Bacillus sp. 1P06AnD TaxID=3132208 RepID=UPI0039A36737
MLNISQNQILDRQAINLLLLADPAEEMINRYISNSMMFQATIHDELVGIAVCQDISPTCIEIKNIAVSQSEQGKGYGRALLQHCIHYGKKSSYGTLKIATGNSSIYQLSLYQSCGFKLTKVDTGYFIRTMMNPSLKMAFSARIR